MANRARLKFSGLDQLREAVKAYGENVSRAAVDAVSDTVERTVQQARSAAPVVTGELRDSIAGSVSTDGYSVTGVVRARARHAAYVEFGTERNKAVPHLVPAAIAERRRLNERLRASVVSSAPADLGRPRVTGDGPGLPLVSIED